MKTFRVTGVMRTFYALDIEAEDEGQAWAIASETDGITFEPLGESDWELYDVTEKELT